MNKAEAQQIVDLKRKICRTISSFPEAENHFVKLCDEVLEKWAKPDTYIAECPDVTDWEFDCPIHFYEVKVKQPDITVDVQGRKYKISFEKAKAAGLVREVTE